MTEKMRAEFEESYKARWTGYDVCNRSVNGDYDSNYTKHAWIEWRACAAHSAETIARLEEEKAAIQKVADDRFRIMQFEEKRIAEAQKTIARLDKELAQVRADNTNYALGSGALYDLLAASQLREKQLREALEKIAELLPKDAQCECVECTSGRVALAALAQPIDTSALDAYVAKKTAWQPIETAPKDRTRILLSDGVTVETGCFASWHSPAFNNEDSGWVVEWQQLSPRPRVTISATRWMPLPQSPDKQGE